MRLQSQTISSAARSFFATPCLYCPHCADPMVAPAASEFVEDQGVRHRWICEACGGETATVFPLSEQ